MGEAFQRSGPWDQPGTLRFYAGPFSQFAVVPGLRLPVSYEGAPTGGLLRTANYRALVQRFQGHQPV
jgi:hypothetical protein